MSEQLFDVVFFGILQAGKDKETVIHNMAALFKTDANKLAPYFAGGRKVIKGKINASAAAKYQAALENVGLVIKIEPCEIQQSETEKENADTVQADISGLTLAPAGSDVIENPVEVPAQDIGDISDFTMAEAGVDVIEHPVEVPAQKIDDISDITMAEAGVDVLDHPQQVTPQKIDDFSALTLADAGADIIENPKPEKKADIPDTSELSLDDESGQKVAE